MASYSIVEDLDVIEHIRSGKVSGFIDPLFDALLFQAAEELFCYRVIPTVTASTHAGFQVMDLTEPMPVVAAILRSLIGMQQYLVCWMASLHRHQQRIYHQATMQCRFHRPSDNTAREKIDNDRQI